MAITRAQIARELYKDGKRVGFKKGRDTDYQQRGQSKQSYSASTQQQNFSARDDGPKGRDLDYQQRGTDKDTYDLRSEIMKDEGTQQVYGAPPKDIVPPSKPKQTKKTSYLDNLSPFPLITKGFEALGKSKLARYNNALQRKNYLQNLKVTDPELYQETIDDLEKLGYYVPDPVEYYGPEEKGAARDIEQFPDIDEEQAKSILNTVRDNDDGTVGTLYDDYLDNQMNRFNAGPSNDPLDPCKGPNPPAYCFIGQNADENMEAQAKQTLTPRILGTYMDPTFFAADGGIMNNDIVGGMMDGNMDEMGRQMYGLGKLVKKATRAVKKIVKSPVGKIALGAAAAKFGGGFGLGGLKGKLFGLKGIDEFGGTMGLLGDLGLTKGFGSFMPTAFGGITLASVLPLLAGKTDEEKDEFLKDYYAQKLEPGTTKRQMGSEFDFYNYNLAEGGMPSKEPVAKKTMPLLDMDGKEKDYRETGGFVDMGRMERADDVPARLSKNEFVFTADAVRNAGDGDIDKGAEVMYNMMKNLESGGDVSEESQGLEGARNMFQTSQRLGEVL